MSALREDQVRRYARHILLPDIGGVGQKRFLAASVTVELGSPCAAELVALAYLAAAGVGHLILTGSPGSIDRPVCDQDIADGILLGTDDIGSELFAAVSARLRALNPDVTISRSAAAGSYALAPALTPAHEKPWWMSTSDPNEGDAVATALIHGGRRAIHTLMGLLHHELA